MNLEEKMLEIISSAPQAGAMEMHHVNNWIKKVIEIDRDRALWHCRRLHGFGGSDAGVLRNSMQGDPNAFGSAHTIIAGKLCLVPPTKGDVHTNRGSTMESFIQLKFEEQLTSMGLNFSRLDSLKNEIEDLKNHEFTWMRSSIDGLYKVGLPNGVTENWLVDFKAPSTDMVKKYIKDAENIQRVTGETTDLGYRIPKRSTREICGHERLPEFNDYIHQLHHYEEDAVLKGVQIDRMVLAAFYYERAEVSLFEIEHDSRVVAENLEACDHFWNSYVLKGVVPEVETRTLVTSDKVSEEDKRNAELMVIYDTAAKILKGKADDIKEALADRAAEIGRLGDEVLSIGAIEVKGKSIPDDDRIQTRLAELGYSDSEIMGQRLPGAYDTTKMRSDYHELRTCLLFLEEGIDNKDKRSVQSALEGFRGIRERVPEKSNGAFDEKKVVDTLLSCGEDPNFFFNEVPSAGVTRKKSVVRDIIKDKVHEVVPALTSALEGDLEKSIEALRDQLRDQRNKIERDHEPRM